MKSWFEILLTRARERKVSKILSGIAQGKGLNQRDRLILARHFAQRCPSCQAKKGSKVQ